jgi:hypothetical protein
MNREKRQFVHEYSDHFGVVTESFDCEPKRNVVATATKDKSWMPSQSIVDVVQVSKRTFCCSWPFCCSKEFFISRSEAGGWRIFA